MFLACSGGGSNASVVANDDSGATAPNGDASVMVTEAFRLEVRIFGVKPILPGEPRRFEAIVIAPDGTETDVTSSATWSSSNGSVVDFEGNQQRNDGWANIPASRRPGNCDC